MNTTIDFKTAKTIENMSRKIDGMERAVSGFFNKMSDIAERKYGDPQVYLAAVGPARDLSAILLEEAPGILPCFDFGHIYARSIGNINSREQFKEILDKIENELGFERMRNMHIHFSRIEYTKAGEKMHHTFADEQWGPDFIFLAQALYEKKAEPVIICESKGTMAEDALNMKNTYEQLISGAGK